MNISKKEFERIKRESFLDGIQASKTIEWTEESEEIERVARAYGYEKKESEKGDFYEKNKS